MVTRRFALRDLDDQVINYYKITTLSARPQVNQNKEPICHHVMIVDRSALSQNLLGQAQHLLLKLCTLEEYRDPDSQVTLISFSQDNDIIVHFKRVPLAILMKEGASERDSLETLSTFKSISHQPNLMGLEQALSYVQSITSHQEVTMTTLHTALDSRSDSDPLSLLVFEKAAELKTQRSVLNVISYELSPSLATKALASHGGGVCVSAAQLRQVYDAISNSSGELTHRVRYVTHISIGNANGWLLTAPQLKESIWGTEDTELLALEEGTEGKLYLFEEIDEITFDRLMIPEINPLKSHGYLSLLAFSRFLLTQHKLTQAKLTLRSARSSLLVKRHLRALTAPQVESLIDDLERILLSGRGRGNDLVLSLMPHEKNDSALPSVIEVLTLLNHHRHQIKLSREHLDSCYIRCTLRRVIGIKNDEGKLNLPLIEARPMSDRDYVQFSGIEFNDCHASLNLITSEKVSLFDVTNTQVHQLAGVELDDLNQFRSYSLVENGELHLATLKLRIESKALFAQLKGWGLIQGTYHPLSYFTLDLSCLPIVRTSPATVADQVSFERLAYARFLRSFLNATLGDYSDRFTETQLEELRAHHLTAKLNLNLPTVSPYPDLKLAQRAGLVDVKERYLIELGNQTFSSLNQLPSANTLLRSTYEVFKHGELIEKPTIDQLTADVDVRLKTRLRASEARSFLRPLFDDLMGLLVHDDVYSDHSSPSAPLDILLSEMGVDATLAQQASQVLRSRSCDELSLATLNTLRDGVNLYIHEYYTREIVPLIFYVGVTGLIPRHYQSHSYLPSECKEALKSFKARRGHDEACVFDLNGSLTLSVRSEEVWFSVDHFEEEFRKVG